jgi:Secretion system C-terminal sorting domain
MKINILYTFFLLFTSWVVLTSTKVNPNNPPVATTGAPGESTCAKSGCHSGGTYTGDVTMSGVPDTILPNTTYPVTVKITSNAVKAGFQLTCLTNTNAMCGTLSTATGVSVGTATATGRKYARQASPKTLTGGSTSWTFNWKSPLTAIDGDITFYYTSLAANGTGNDNGDNVFASTKKVIFQATSATNEIGAASWLDFGIDNASKSLKINLLQASKGTLQIFDLQGKLIQSNQLSSSNSLAINNLEAGIYVVKINANGKNFAKKISVN